LNKIAKCLPKLGDTAFVDSKSRGGGVSTAADEKFFAGMKRFMQVDKTSGTPASGRVLLSGGVARDDDDRSLEFFCQTAGDNPDDPDVPSGGMQHQGGFAGQVILLSGLFGCSQDDAPFERFSIRVQPFQVLGQHFRAVLRK
jgi:hypothetical protein